MLQVVRCYPFVATPSTSRIGDQADNHDSAVNVDLPWPTDMRVGDIAFIHAVAIDTFGDAVTINVPSGFAQVAQGNMRTFNYRRTGVFWRRIDGTETGTVTLSRTGTLAGSDCVAGNIIVFRGCIDTGTPYEGLQSNGGGATTNIDSLELTTLGDNRLVLHFLGFIDRTITPEVGYTTIYKRQSVSGFTNGGWGIYSKEQALAGTVPAATFTASTSTDWRVFSLALIPQ